jgi:hypothetical protein
LVYFVTFSPVRLVLRGIFIINAVLAIINLIPVPPLDGSSVWPCIIPQLRPAISKHWSNIWFIVLLIFLYTGGIDRIVVPVLGFLSSLLPTEPSRYHKLRSYLGFCFECNCGCEVVQFVVGERWLIHKYQKYNLVASGIACEPTGEWIELNKMPQPAPVVLGPGGEYDTHINLLPVIKSVQQIIDTLNKTLMCLVQGLGTRD